jgi:hypothetical protein
MGARGTLTEKSVMPDIDLLRTWAIDAVQVQTRDLVSNEGVSLNVPLLPGVRRSFATPFLRVKAVVLRIEAAGPAAINVFTRVNGTREILLASLPARQEVLRIPVPQYRTDAMIIETPASSSAVNLRHLAIETVDGAVLSVSPFSSYLSDPGFQEIALTPQIKAFRILRTRSLVEGRSGAVSRGPTPDGRLEIESPDRGSADIALVPLPGWSANVPLRVQTGHLTAELNAGASVLRYTPPLFLAATFLASIGLLISFTLLFRPTIAARLLKSGRDEGK